MGVLSMGQQLCSDQARHSASPGPNTVQWGSMRTGWKVMAEMFCMNVRNSGIVAFFCQSTQFGTVVPVFVTRQQQTLDTKINICISTAVLMY